MAPRVRGTPRWVSVALWRRSESAGAGSVEKEMSMFRRRLTDELNRRDQLAGALLGLGALNWGLVGLANFDAVRAVLGKTVGVRVVTA